MDTKNILADILCSYKNYPDNKAFVIEGKEYSYKELFSKINGILSHISDSGQVIGVVAENRIETYASILAILIAGKTYVILHPDYPVYRNQFIAEITGMQQVFYAQEHQMSVHMPKSLRFICTEGIRDENTAHLSLCGPPDSNAYIIFTSGSTGVPKGVPISRRNLNAFYTAYSNLGWTLGPEDRMLQTFELTFDISVISLLHPLTLGACIYTVSPQRLKYMQVFELLEEQELTSVTIPPSLLQFLSPYFDEIYLPKLKYLIVSAEASNADLVHRFMHCAPNASFIDLYGPTEACIYCTAYNIPQENCKQYNGMIAIGKPLQNMEAIIVNENGEILPTGEKGELCISGPQLMQGYWKDPERSETAFIHPEGNKIYYKTGDLCYIDQDKDIIYCGRKDYQVKIQGFRVELSEIEYTARLYYPHQVNVVAIPQYGEDQGCKLHLFIEAEPENQEGLMAFLKARLPRYMLPEDIHFIKEFPQNQSNKTDRKKISSLI